MSWNRILAEAPQVDDRNGVAYFEVASKRVLNPVNVPNLPFDASLNPYLNCEVGCTYCYARDFSNRRQAGTGTFDGEIYAKADAPALLRKELARLERRGELGQPIALGTATDPYQPLEKRAELTRRLLEVFADHGGVRVSITTKSDLVTRDLDVLQALSKSGYVRVNMTITTLDRDLARSLEPRAPIPSKRLAAIEKLTAAGIPAGVFCMPVIPDVNDQPRSLRHLLCAAQEAGAQFFASRVLELKPGVRPAFFAWLQRERPGLVPRFRRRYKNGPNAPQDVAEPIERCVALLRQQYGMPATLPLPAPRRPAASQLELFAEETEPAPPPPRPRRLPTALQGAA